MLGRDQRPRAPQPRRVVSERDYKSASELRRRLDRRAAPEWLDMASLRRCFGGEALSPTRKREVEHALNEAGIEVYPPLTHVPNHEKVRLDAIHAIGPGHPLSDRLRSRIRRVRAKLLSPASAAVGLAASLVTLAGVITVSDGGGQLSAPRVMTGDLNVAIAPFTSHGRSNDVGTALALDVAHAMPAQLRLVDPALDVQFRGPDQVGSLAGSSPVDQARAAGALASRLHADIVVYGDIETSATMTTMTPLFYLNRAKLPSASALAGSFGYGLPFSTPFPLGVNPQARAQMRAELIKRTAAYAAIFVGVGYYLRHQLAAAAEYLQRALTNAPSPESIPLLQLLLGNVADQSGRSATAARYYTLASRSTETRIRADLGLAEVAYATSHGDCAPMHVAATGLLTARAGFSRVLAALAQSPTTTSLNDPSVGAKAEFGLGQVDLCLSASHTAARWSRARTEFTSVADTYQPAFPDLRDDAAEAHAGIGFVDLSTERTVAGFMQAGREYETAARLATIGRRQAYFYDVLGYVDDRLGDHAAAVIARRRAALAASEPPTETIAASGGPR
jgi:hypothetical protein